MALIKCPECNREVSDKAEMCPYCGCPAKSFSTDSNNSINEQTEAISKPTSSDLDDKREKTKQCFIIFVGVFVALCVFMFVFAILAESALKNNNTNDSSVAKEIKTNDNDKYEDDFVKFNYNSNLVVNTVVDNKAAPYSLLVELKKHKVDRGNLDYTKLFTDNSFLSVFVFNDNSSKIMSEAFKENYKSTLADILNASCNTDEISESDVIWNLSTNAAVDKNLSNGSRIKARVLSQQSDGFSVVICNILPNINDKDKQELINIFDDIVYKKLSVNKDNLIFLGKEAKIAGVFNGQNDIIGKRAYIEITKDELNAMSEQEILGEFKRIDNTSYNWFTIVFGDGTGIQFNKTLVARYGEINDEGIVTKTTKTINLN